MPAVVEKEKCTACKACVDACPNGAVSIPDDVAVVNEAECIDCAACVDACSTGAITMK